MDMLMRTLAELEKGGLSIISTRYYAELRTVDEKHNGLSYLEGLRCILVIECESHSVRANNIATRELVFRKTTAH
jgi:hypothetical protein